jgi:hypothetical protein
MINIVEIHKMVNDNGEISAQSRVIRYESFDKYVEEFKKGESHYNGQRSLPRATVPNIVKEQDRLLFATFVNPVWQKEISHEAFVLDVNYGV